VRRAPLFLPQRPAFAAGFQDAVLTESVRATATDAVQRIAAIGAPVP